MFLDDTPAALVVLPPSALSRTGPQPGDLALAYIGRMRSDAGRASARWRLDVAARMLSGGRADALGYPWHALTPAHVSTLASALADGTGRGGQPYGPRTANAILAAVRGVARETWRAGWLEADGLARLVDVKGEPLPTVRAGRYVEPGERMALWHATAADRLAIRGARDAALLALLDGAGLRASEAAGATWQGLDAAAEVVTVRGKGRKVRAVPLATGGADALDAWREALESATSGGKVDHPVEPRENGGNTGSEDVAWDGADATRDDTGAAILRTVDRHGNAGGPLPVRGIARALDRLARATGGACRPLTPHDLRRSFVSDLLDAGADLSAVAGMAGHAAVTTTAGYDRRGARAMAAAARLRSVPYMRPAGR